MSVKKIVVPDLGDIGEVELIEISVKVGDSIGVNDTLVVLESDKASMDVPAETAGVVEKILVSVGDKLQQGSDLMMMATTNITEKEEEVAQQPLISSETESAVINDEATIQPEADGRSQALQLKDICIPDMGDLENVTLIELNFNKGDTVNKEQTLLVLESDKASIDVPSPFAGEIAAVTVSVGDLINSGDKIGEMLVAPSSLQETKISLSSALSVSEKATVSIEQPLRPPVPERPAISHAPSKGLVHASPAIRRFARELGAELSKIRGTGIKGRVLKQDVQLYIKDELARPKATATSGNLSSINFPTIDYSKFGDIESVPLSRIQKLSSVNLHRNWVSIPHVTQFDESDITELEKFRKSLKEEAAAEGVKVTPLIFMLKAVASTLKVFPTFNASLDNNGENLILKKFINIGVAVDTPVGLVVPVIRDVDKKSLYELARELAETSQKARDGKLSPLSMQGSCFTISSLGGIGGTAFTPIVNWPDVAILGVSRSQMKPVWNGSEFIPRLMLPLSLSYDHRVVDGALAARFTTCLSKVLADIRRILL